MLSHVDSSNCHATVLQHFGDLDVLIARSDVLVIVLVNKCSVSNSFDEQDEVPLLGSRFQFEEEVVQFIVREIGPSETASYQIELEQLQLLQIEIDIPNVQVEALPHFQSIPSHDDLLQANGIDVANIDQS